MSLPVYTSSETYCYQAGVDIAAHYEIIAGAFSCPLGIDLPAAQGLHSHMLGNSQLAHQVRCH